MFQLLQLKKEATELKKEKIKMITRIGERLDHDQQKY